MTELVQRPSVLALVGDPSGPSLWRIFQPFRALSADGYPCGWVQRQAADLDRIVQQFDGFVLPRLAWPPEQRARAARLFDVVHRAERFVVFEADDDLFTSAYTHRAVAIGMHEGKSFERLEAERFERIWAMTMCDGVTVSTQRLATVVRSYTNKPVIVVPNAIDIPWFRGVLRTARRQTQGLTIGWVGGARSERDVEQMAAGWARLAASHPSVKFVVQGHVPESIVRAVPPERLVVVPWLALERYPLGLAEIDIGCAAVADEPFNRCKSAIKAYEYAVAGAAVVATPTVYGSVVEHERTGYLAETSDEWEHALGELVSRPALRSIMAKRLLRVVEREHSLAVNVQRWPLAWQQVAEDARSRRGRLVTV